MDCVDGSDENYMLCGYPKSGRPTVTQSTTNQPTNIESGNKIYTAVTPGKLTAHVYRNFRFIILIIDLI